jgi:uncharacterized membrane protein
MKSKLFTLAAPDWLKGLIMAGISAVVTYAYQAIQSGTLFNVTFLKGMGLAAAGAILSYLIKNFFTNSQDKFATPEPK